MLGCPIILFRFLAEFPILLRAGSRPPTTRQFRANICMKGVHSPEGFPHPDRSMIPLRLLGERGSGRWEASDLGPRLGLYAARLSAVLRNTTRGFAVRPVPVISRPTPAFWSPLHESVGEPELDERAALAPGIPARSTDGLWFVSSRITKGKNRKKFSCCSATTREATGRRLQLPVAPRNNAAQSYCARPKTAAKMPTCGYRASVWVRYLMASMCMVG